MSSTAYDATREVKALLETDAINAKWRLQEVINKALQSDNPTLQHALKQEYAFRKRTEEELDELLKNIQKLMSEKDAQQVKKATLEKLATDLELVTLLNNAVVSYNSKDTQPKDYSESDKNTCTYPLKFNKMALAIPGATTLVSKHFKELFCIDSLPDGYVYRSQPREVTVIGKNPHSIYGDSKGTFLKTAALTVHLACTGTTRLQDIGLKAKGASWIDETAMAHVTHLPNNLDLTKIDKRFEQFTYAFSDSVIQQGFSFVHSGYSYGGQRDTAYRYKEGTKLFGPEDCSSWISKLSGSPIQFSTIDQLYSYRLRILKDFGITLGAVPDDYAATQTPTTMGELFDPVMVKDPQKDIRPGQIYAHRSYDLTADSTKQGPGTKGGHTGVVLDFISSGKESNVVILAYGRDMPNEEGFGIQQFPFAQENRQVMLFSVKAQNLSENTKDKSGSAEKKIGSHEKSKP